MQAMERGSSSKGKKRSRGEEGEHVTTNSGELGDVIYIKLRRGTWWPAQVVDEYSVSESNKPRKGSAAEVLVRIYGSSQYMYADPIKSRNQFEKMLKQTNSSETEIFLQTLEQDLPSSKLSKSTGSESKTKANVRKTSKESGKLKDLEANSSKAQDNVGRSLIKILWKVQVDRNINSENERSNNPRQDDPLITIQVITSKGESQAKVPKR